MGGQSHSKLQKEYEEHFFQASPRPWRKLKSKGLLLPKDYLGDGEEGAETRLKELLAFIKDGKESPPFKHPWNRHAAGWAMGDQADRGPPGRGQSQGRAHAFEHLKTLRGERKQGTAHMTSVSKRMLVGLLPMRVGKATPGAPDIQPALEPVNGESLPHRHTERLGASLSLGNRMW